MALSYFQKEIKHINTFNNAHRPVGPNFKVELYRQIKLSEIITKLRKDKRRLSS